MSAKNLSTPFLISSVVLDINLYIHTYFIGSRTTMRNIIPLTKRRSACAELRLMACSGRSLILLDAAEGLV